MRVDSTVDRQAGAVLTAIFAVADAHPAVFDATRQTGGGVILEYCAVQGSAK
jgi:hypothetical protein